MRGFALRDLRYDPTREVEARWKTDGGSWRTDDELCVAAINGLATSDAPRSPRRNAPPAWQSEPLLSVTLAGPLERVNAWLADQPDAARLMLPHPWHHPTYLDVPAVRDGSEA